MLCAKCQNDSTTDVGVKEGRIVARFEYKMGLERILQQPQFGSLLKHQTLDKHFDGLKHN